MEEPEASTLTRRWLEEKGYKLKAEVGIPHTEREVVLDYHAYRDNPEPEILWIEVKGNVSISQLLEGYIRTEMAVFYGGGKGILAAPHEATQKLLKYRNFLKSDGTIAILDIETCKSFPM